ncbi:MAG TPA: serine/threonine-protein kinase [Iamia sp.]|jgi:serine/threonine protein kinase|nr:serine/threonine-protein kinase [Iamia sp.]
MERIADYQFIQPLGEGSSGKYFLAATPTRLGIAADHVAVKVLQVSAGEEAFHRLTRELRTFAKVRSANLVTLYDAGQEAGQCYYAMEFCPGGSLAYPTREVTREGAVAAVSAAARAAHDLHEAGIAHRDIKPANILLTDDGAKLADLGLVQVLAPGQTITGLGAIGSVEYLDPAIMRGERASRATDIWALGVTLHRVLTGKGVYGDLPARDPLLAVRRVLSSPPTLDPSLSDAEAELIRRCLDPDLSARFRTAAEVADALDALGRAA